MLVDCEICTDFSVHVYLKTGVFKSTRECSSHKHDFHIPWSWIKYLCAERQNDVSSLCHADTRSPFVVFHEERDHFAGMTLQRQSPVTLFTVQDRELLQKHPLLEPRTAWLQCEELCMSPWQTLKSRDPQHFYPQAHLLHVQCWKIQHCTYGIRRQRTQGRA